MRHPKPKTHEAKTDQLWDAIVGTNGEGMQDRLKRVEENMVTKKECSLIQREAVIDDWEDRVDISKEITKGIKTALAERVRDPVLDEKDRRAKWQTRVSTIVGITVLVAFAASLLGVQLKGGVKRVLKDWLDQPIVEVVNE